MSYIQENIKLLSSFCTTDSKTVENIKSLVLPWAKAELANYKRLEAESGLDDLFYDEISVLIAGIAACEQRLTTLEG